jgi:hypothetical protein
VKSLFRACAVLIALSAPTAAQQLSASGTLTPSTAVSPQGPLTFTPAKIVNPLDFGARCDGSTDDTSALTSWASAVRAGSRLVLPGACIFKSPIAFPQVNDVTIEGSGHSGALIYAGALTTGNIITIGTTNGGCSVVGWSIHGVRLMSNTVMTAGDALRLNDVCESDFANLDIGGDLGGNQNWFNAIHFNGGNSARLRGYSFSGSGSAELVNGDAGAQYTDLFQANGKLSHSGVGLHIAGNVGGMVIDQTDILLNGANVLIDQSQTAVANSQLFFGFGVAVDATNNAGGGSQIGIEFADAGGANSVVFFTGTWIGTSGRQCVLFDSGVQWQATFSGGSIANCHPPSSSNGALENDSLNTIIGVSGTKFFLNGGNGPDVNNTVANNSLSISGARFAANPNGNIAGPWGGSYIDAANNQVVSAASNLTFTAGPGKTLIQGAAGGPCGLWIQGALEVPGNINGSGAGCSFQIGSGAYPLTALTATTTYTTSLYSGAGLGITAASGSITELASGSISQTATIGQWSAKASGNASVQAGSGFTAVFGAGTTAANCGLWGQNGLLTPGKMDGSSAGCALQLGTGPYPLSGAYTQAVELSSYTVSTLPTCGSTVPGGTIAYVTDASSPAYNATLTGGSSTKTLAMCNGSNWTAH